MKKKKVAIKKKTGHSGPRGEGGKRKGGSDGAGSVRASEWAQPKPDMNHLDLLEASSASSQAGNIVAYSASTLAALEHFGLPKQLGITLRAQPRPRTLVRAQSVALFEELTKAAGGRSAEEQTTSVLYGPSGSGASTLLVQSVAHALDQGWIVLYLPSLISLVNSTSPYVFDATQKTYLQPQLVQQILRALVAVNEARLKEVVVDEQALEVAKAAAGSDTSSSASSSSSSSSGSADASILKSGASLHTLASAGAAESTSPFLAQILFETVLRTLSTQSTHPFLLALDDFQALYASSRYRDPDYNQLASYDLAVPRALLQLVRGGEGWAIHRGAVLGALSHEHAPLSFPAVARELYISLGLADGQPTISQNPFANLQRTHLKHVAESHLRVRHVMTHDLEAPQGLAAVAFGAGSRGGLITASHGLQKAEAGVLFECLKRERGIFSPANDELFLSKLIESGGNLGLFERGLQRTLL